MFCHLSSCCPPLQSCVYFSQILGFQSCLGALETFLRSTVEPRVLSPSVLGNHAVAGSMHSSVVSVLHGPLAGLVDGATLITLPVISDSLSQWVINVRRRHQSLNRDEHGPDHESGRPLVLQDVQADATYENLIKNWLTRKYYTGRCSCQFRSEG